MKNRAKWFLILHILLAIYAISALLSKMASGTSLFSIPFVLMYGGVLVALVLYACGWQQVIKHLPLTTAYTNKAVTIVWGILFGIIFFHETVTPKQVLGAAAIIAGVVLFVKADAEDQDE